MQRPYVVCHMMTALDGKITGPFMDTPEADLAGEVYEETNESYRPDTWMCGRVTTDENFTFYQKPELDEAAPLVPAGDYAARTDAPMYYVSLDASGKIGWTSNTLRYAGRPEAHIIELLTGRAGNAYKAYLRRLGISYIIAGEENLDCALALTKLRELFGIQRLMLSGGGFVNWTFLQAGLVDELSLVLAPVADGQTDTVTLFERADSLPVHGPVGFRLKSAEAKQGGSVWLRYLVKNER